MLLNPEITRPQINLYKNKLDCMISALNKYMHLAFDYVVPSHGMFVWLEFSKLNIEEYKEYIFEKSKVLFIPASAFLAGKSTGKQAMRLNFTYPSCEQIILGIKNLADCLNSLEKNH